jgi:hypothetical protein
MNDAQKRALARGRERAARARRREAVRRVENYKAWLAIGSPFDRRMPTVPTDSDYRIARGEVNE